MKKISNFPQEYPLRVDKDVDRTSLYASGKFLNNQPTSSTPTQDMATINGQFTNSTLLVGTNQNDENTFGDDIIVGGDNAEVIVGQQGSDDINGGNGNDTILRGFEQSECHPHAAGNR